MPAKPGKTPLAASTAPTQVAAPRELEVLPGSPPSVNSTQTMRSLDLPELFDHRWEKLLVIQLALSETEFAPESVPNLAIFREYHLYSAVTREQGKVMHALRLGFFSDEAPANAVAGYLRGYFEALTVARVSAEERERLANRRVAARKESGDSGVHAAIELSSRPAAPRTSLADLAVRTSGDTPEESRDGARRRSPQTRK
jgi:hypothetical protein